MEIVGRASRSKRERQAAEAVAREAKKLEEQMSAIEVEWFGAPLHGSDLAKCAVVGITNGTWRNSALEAVHGDDDGRRSYSDSARRLRPSASDARSCAAIPRAFPKSRARRRS